MINTGSIDRNPFSMGIDVGSQDSQARSSSVEYEEAESDTNVLNTDDDAYQVMLEQKLRKVQ